MKNNIRPSFWGPKPKVVVPDYQMTDLEKSWQMATVDYEKIAKGFSEQMSDAIQFNRVEEISLREDCEEGGTRLRDIQAMEMEIDNRRSKIFEMEDLLKKTKLTMRAYKGKVTKAMNEGNLADAKTYTEAVTNWSILVAVISNRVQKEKKIVGDMELDLTKLVFNDQKKDDPDAKPEVVEKYNAIHYRYVHERSKDQVFALRKAMRKIVLSKEEWGEKSKRIRNAKNRLMKYMWQFTKDQTMRLKDNKPLSTGNMTMWGYQLSMIIISWAEYKVAEESKAAMEKALGSKVALTDGQQKWKDNCLSALERAMDNYDKWLSKKAVAEEKMERIGSEPEWLQEKFFYEDVQNDDKTLGEDYFMPRYGGNPETMCMMAEIMHDVCLGE